MSTMCPMGGRVVMSGDVVICTDSHCRVTQYAASWEVKRRWLARAKIIRSTMRVCVKCGKRTDATVDGEPVCESSACRVLTFTGGIIE